MSISPKILTTSYTGPVFWPPPYAASHPVREQTSLWNSMMNSGYVMKITPTDRALREIRIRHALERRWLSCKTRFGVQSLEQIFVLPLETMRDMETYPPVDAEGRIMVHPRYRQKYMGLYAEHKGTTWSSYFGDPFFKRTRHAMNDAEYREVFTRTISIVVQLLRALLILHQLNMTHNDIWIGNLLIDTNHTLRIIDWESCALHHTDVQKHDDHWLHEQVGWGGYARNFWQVYRKWDQKGHQIRGDWNSVVMLLKWTYPCTRWSLLAMNLYRLESNPTDAGAQELLEILTPFQENNS